MCMYVCGKLGERNFPRHPTLPAENSQRKSQTPDFDASLIINLVKFAKM